MSSLNAYDGHIYVSMSKHIIVYILHQKERLYFRFWINVLIFGLYIRLHIYVNLSHPKIFRLTTFKFQHFHQENEFSIVKVCHNLCMGILMLGNCIPILSE